MQPLTSRTASVNYRGLIRVGEFDSVTYSYVIKHIAADCGDYRSHFLTNKEDNSDVIYDLTVKALSVGH